jgi:long-chain acyl-CoA synthetase
MNLAYWLARAGSSHGDLPALGLGSQVVRRYGDLAKRAAQLASSLRERLTLRPGDRVAIAAKNCPEYVKLMFGVWHAGLAAVPTNAKLHGRELGYILEHSGARVCFATDDVAAETARHAPATLERLVTIGSAEYEALFTADPADVWRSRGDELAWLFYTSGTTGPITTLSKEEIADRNHPRWAERLASAGRPFATVEVMVADGDDRELPVGEAGEVLCRGDVVMAGYWRNPEASAATLKGGWLHTGDIGALDSEGYLTLKDRSKDVIISGGSNIYPREVEEILLEHLLVREVSVIGRPDPEWGEVVVAYVVGEADCNELDTLCLKNIARFKRPKEYVFVDALPKNNYGKILKTELRDLDATKRREG